MESSLTNRQLSTPRRITLSIVLPTIFLTPIILLILHCTRRPLLKPATCELTGGAPEPGRRLCAVRVTPADAAGGGASFVHVLGAKEGGACARLRDGRPEPCFFERTAPPRDAGAAAAPTVIVRFDSNRRPTQPAVVVVLAVLITANVVAVVIAWSAGYAFLPFYLWAAEEPLSAGSKA